MLPIPQEIDIEETAPRIVDEAPVHPNRFWPIAAFLCFGGGSVSFLFGLVISAVAALGIITVSRFTAYLTVATLLTAFGLTFLGAHCLDRDRSNRKKKSDQAE